MRRFETYWRVSFAAIGLIGLGLLVLLDWQTERAVSQEAPPDNAIEVQARGPLHEAFAEPVSTRPRPSAVVPKQPPEPIPEEPPAQKPEGANVQWIPGYWAFDDDRGDFIWISGFWRDVPPDRQWVPGYWTQTQEGWQWVPGFWSDTQQVQYVPPPPDPIEAGPSTPAPGQDYTYNPGCWVYRETRFWWRPGFWVRLQPDWCWIPAHYCWSPTGYIFLDGYWDYAPANRGLLFAPAFIDYNNWRRDWVYRPRYALAVPALLTSLFVRPEFNHYYFGDYYDTGYTRRGFVPWFEYRVGSGSSDPLYSYSRWQNRSDPRWDREVRTLHAERQAGTTQRPPRTLVEQNTLINKINNKQTTNVRVENVTLVSTLEQSAEKQKLRPIPATEHERLRKDVQQERQIQQHRQKQETQLLSKGPAPARAGDAPHSAKLELARPAAPAAAPKAAVKPPARPAAPQHQEKAAPKHEPPKAHVVPKGEGPRQTQEPKQTEKAAPKQAPPEPKAAPKQAAPPEPKAAPKQAPPEPKAAPKQAAPPPEPKAAPKQAAPPEPKAAPKHVPPPEPKAAPAPPPPPRPAPPAPKDGADGKGKGHPKDGKDQP